MATARLWPLFVIQFAPTAALATGVTENVDYTAIRPFILVDSHVLATATAGVSGTAQILRQALGSGGFTAVHAALAMTTSGALTRTTTLTAAQAVIAPTDVVRCAFVDGGGAGGANGNEWLTLVATVITGA